MNFSFSNLTRVAVLVAAAFPLTVSAQVLNMEAGESQVIKTNQKIDTIFVSSPEIADYEIVGDSQYIIYAKGDGVAEVTAFDADGNALSNNVVNVNGVMKGIDIANSQIRAAFPNSGLSVKKVGKAYVIEGKARSEIERQEVNRIVGAALGASEEVTEKEIDGVKIPFLNDYRYKEVVDNSITGDSTQINVHLSIVDVSKTLSEELGVQWNNLPGSIASLVTGNATRNIAFGTGGNVVGAGGAIGFSADNLNGFIHALQDDKKAKVLAEPNISMLSGEVGSILVGGEVPFVQRSENGYASVFYKEYGIKLDVGAKLLKDDRIRVALSQEVSNVVNYGSTEDGVPIPLIHSRKSKSTFEVPNGGSFVLGGLYSENDSGAVQKFPILGDIPIIGAFFRNVAKSRDKRELIVIATVNVVKPVNKSDIVYPEYYQSGLLEDYFAYPGEHLTQIKNFFKRAGFSQ